jgi:hypothetical protein
MLDVAGCLGRIRYMPRYSTGDAPKPPDNPQKFFRVATQRYEEAQFLFEGERYLAAIYIGGYAIECGLKALILETEPRNGRAELAASFRGSEWHNLNWLVEGYIKRGGSRLPREIRTDLTYVHDEWSVDLRYTAGQKTLREGQRFVAATVRILEWVKGRLSNA